MVKQRTPGPGAYNLDVRPITPSSPSYSMAPRTLTTHINGSDELPGPGSYALPKTDPGPAFTMPGKPHPAAGSDDKKALPGPGAYNSHSAKSVIHPREPAYTLAGRTRPSHRHASPGPGAYTLPSKESGPAVTIQGKRTASSAATTPGPGAYCATARPGSPAYTMGIRCSQGKRDPSPGPGAYNHSQANGGPSYTIPKRFHDSHRNETPGPGAYQVLPSATHQREPAFSISAKFKECQQEGTPGPGSYSIPPTSKLDPGPAFSIVSKPNDGSHRPSSADTPGPGSYHYEEKLHDTGPAYSIAGKGPKSRSESVPGPGAYTPKDPALASGPAYSIPRKLSPARKFDTPGPAAYNLDLHPTTVAQPAYTMGIKYDKHGKDRENVPGPGAYDARTKNSGPMYSICSGTQRFTDF